MAGSPANFLEEGAGPTLFFVHDWLSTAVGFAPLVLELGPRYHKVRVDLPGFGKTLPPEEWDYALSSYGDFLNGALRESASRDATLITHGFGTLAALGALSREAGEAQRRVSRLILLNSPLYEDPPKGVFSMLQKSPLETLAAAPPSDLTSFRRRILRLYGDPTYFDERYVEEVYASWKAQGRRTFLGITQHLPALVAGLPALREVLQTWTAPVHLLWGEDDPWGQDPALRFHKEVPRAKLLFFPEVGYLPHAEAPRNVSDEIRKVVRVSRPPAPSGPRADTPEEET